MSTHDSNWRISVNKALNLIEAKLCGKVQTKPTNHALCIRLRAALKKESRHGRMTRRISEIADYLRRLAPFEHQESHLPAYFDNQNSDNFAVVDMKDDYLLNKINYMARNHDPDYPSSLFEALLIERAIRWAGR